VADRLAACIKDPRSPERKRFVEPEPAQRAGRLPKDQGTKHVKLPLLRRCEPITPP
jgi:hypothetical protein